MPTNCRRKEQQKWAVSLKVRLATTCEAMIGEFEDAEMEVLPIFQDDHFFSIKCKKQKKHIKHLKRTKTHQVYNRWQNEQNLQDFLCRNEDR